MNVGANNDWEAFTEQFGSEAWDSLAQIEFVTRLERLIGRTLLDSELQALITKEGAKSLFENLLGNDD